MHPIDDLNSKMEQLSLKNHTKNGAYLPPDGKITPPRGYLSTENEITTKENGVAYIVIDHNNMCAGYMDLRGRFPQKSSRGNKYVLVAYHYDAYVIFAEPLKDRTATTLTKTWKISHKKFKLSSNQPDIYVLDNEKSNELIKVFSTKPFFSSASKILPTWASISLTIP